MLRKTSHQPPLGIAIDDARLTAKRLLLSGLVLSMAIVGSSASARPLPSRESRCGDVSGLQRARCERQRELQAICGAVQGDARSQCERCFMAGNTIPCETYDGDERRQCDAEIDALLVCSDGPVETFMPCLGAAQSTPPVAFTARR